MINLEMSLSPEDAAFRDEVRTFLDEKFTPELQAEASRQTGVFADGDLVRRWQRVLFERGWIAPTWPKKFGGAEMPPMQQYILSVAFAEAGTPVLPGFGLQMCGPVLMRYGTPEQQDYHLPRILSGEHYWCQGYSEPQAGSDLAALKCRAVRDGDDYVVDGQKIWTTHAHFADWIFLLVRTSSEGAPQAGISFLLVDLRTPGITVRPIISISGEHEVNEVFFDGVRVPVSNLVGEQDRGWSVAKFLLLNERGGGSAAAPLKSALARLRAILSSFKPARGSDFYRRLSEVEIDVVGIEMTERATVAALARGDAKLDDSMASVQKLAVTETLQKISELAVEAIGPYAAIDQGEALFGPAPAAPIGAEAALTPVAQYLNMRACTIFGGSSEIQRNILARVALGL